MLVVQLASGLTLSIAGVFKEVLTIVSSVLIFGDQLTPFNVAGLLICLALVADSEARRSAAARRAAKKAKVRAQTQVKAQAQSYRRVTRAGIDADEKKDGSVFESIKDQAPTPMRLGKATPELLHKLSWALPSSLREELVEKMWCLGYDPEFVSEGPMGIQGGPQGALRDPEGPQVWRGGGQGHLPPTIPKPLGLGRPR